jgi:CRISPR-associated protein Cas5d
MYFADEDRTQRNTVALCDVDYLVQARFRLTDRAQPAETVAKFVEMFERRVGKGQHFHQPYFGCREFSADVIPGDGAPPPVADSRDLGLMLWDIDFQKGKNRPLFFEARLSNGVLEIPEHPLQGGAE